MTPPPLKTRLLGHAVVVLPMSGITLWSLYQLMLNTDTWPMTVLVFVLMGGVMRANDQVTAYRAWKRAWDGMAPAAPAGPRRPRYALAVLLVGMVAAYLWLPRIQPGHMLALGWMAAVAIVAMIVIMVRATHRWRAQRPVAMLLVAICIRKPLLPVPDMKAAYTALPAHCWQVL